MFARLLRRAPRPGQTAPDPDPDPGPACWVRTAFIPWRVPATLSGASPRGCQLSLRDRVEPGDHLLLEPAGSRPLPARVTRVTERPGGPASGGFDARVEFETPLTDAELRGLLGSP